MPRAFPAISGFATFLAAEITLSALFGGARCADGWASSSIGSRAQCSVVLPAALTVREVNGVLRIKGFAAVRGKPMRLLVQAVGPRVTTQYDRHWAVAEKRETRLVVIGLKGLDQTKIVRMLNG